MSLSVLLGEHEQQLKCCGRSLTLPFCAPQSQSLVVVLFGHSTDARDIADKNLIIISRLYFTKFHIHRLLISSSSSLSMHWSEELQTKVYDHRINHLTDPILLRCFYFAFCKIILKKEKSNRGKSGRKSFSSNNFVCSDASLHLDQTEKYPIDIVFLTIETSIFHNIAVSFFMSVTGSNFEIDTNAPNLF